MAPPAEAVHRPRTEALPFDHTLRYFVPSTRNKGKYLVQLDSYKGNGECQCPHFAMRLEPLLSRGFSPSEAVEGRLVKLKENRHVEDALRCEHILTARAQFCDDVVAAIAAAERAQAPKYPNSRNQ